MNITGHISQLLYQHRCVVIPGFGGIIANDAPARIHPVQHTFTPPSKQLAFNQRLKENDGLLLNRLVKREKLTQQEGEQRIGAYVQDLQRDLREKQLVILPRIGKLYYDVEKKLQFVPNQAVNYRRDAFGLTTFQSRPVLRKERAAASAHAGQVKTATSANRISAPTPKTEEKDPDLTTKRKTPKAPNQNRKQTGGAWRTIAYTSVAAALAVLLVFQWQQSDLSVRQVKHQVSDLTTTLWHTVSEAISNKLTDEPEEEVASPTLSEADPSTKKTAEAPAADKATPQPGAAPATVAYYAVVGSFRERANAESHANQLRNAGEKVKILRNGPNHRVAISGFNSEEEVQKRLPEIHQQYNAQAWVLAEE